MSRHFTEHELEAYLDESLAPQEMSAIEAALRAQPELMQRLANVNGRRNSGVHTVGEIWRRHRLSCPTREQLGSFLLGVLDDDHADYLKYHIESIGCRICQANLEDLRQQQAEDRQAETVTRRGKFFKTSAGLLRGDK
jgi:hypothetical protein